MVSMETTLPILVGGALEAVDAGGRRSHTAQQSAPAQAEGQKTVLLLLNTLAEPKQWL